MDKIIVKTQIGSLEVTGDESYIYEVKFLDEADAIKYFDKISGLALWEEGYFGIYSLKNSQINKTSNIYRGGKEIIEYFQRKRKEFTVPVKITEKSEFRKKVYKELIKVPYGEVITYGELGDRVGVKFSGQAVGQAMKNNKIAIILPCHRVVGKGGDITGYAGGIQRKKLLLELERNKD